MKLLFLLLFLFMFATSAAAQEIKMSLTMRPASSLSSGDATIFPAKSDSYQFKAGEGGTFNFASLGGGSAKIVFSAEATQATLDFFIDSYDQNAVIATRPLPAGQNVVGGLIYDMRAFEGTAETSTFGALFAITMSYLDSQIENANEETLNVYFWNETQNTWETFASSAINIIDNTITIFTNHLTLFAILGGPSSQEQSRLAASGVSLPPLAQVSDSLPLFAKAENETISQPAKTEPAITTEPAAEKFKEKKSEIEKTTTIGGVALILKTDSKKETPQARVAQAPQEPTPPTLFDVGIQPETEERPERWKEAVAIGAVIAVVVALAGGYILSRKKYG